MQDYLSVLTISTSTKNEAVKEVIDIVKSEMETLKNKPISQQRLDDTKSYIIGSLPLGLSSTDKIAGILLSLQLDNRDINYLDHYKKNIEAVTIDDVQKVAQRLLNSNKILTLMVGQPENIENFIELKNLPNVK